MKNRYKRNSIDGGLVYRALHPTHDELGQDIVPKGTEFKPNAHVGHGSENSRLVSFTGSPLHTFTRKQGDMSDVRVTGSPIIVTERRDYLNLSDPEVRKEIGLTAPRAIRFAEAQEEVLFDSPIKASEYSIFAEPNVFKNIWEEIVGSSELKSEAEHFANRVVGTPVIITASDAEDYVNRGIRATENFLLNGSFREAMLLLYSVEYELAFASSLKANPFLWWKLYSR